MEKRLNILFISSWYPCRNKPFNGNFVQRHAIAVSKYANVSVVFVCSDPTVKEVIKQENIKDNFRELIIYYPKIKYNIPVVSFLYKYFKVRRLYDKAYNEIREKTGEIDVIHANVLYPIGKIALFFKRKYKIPFVVTEHWTGFISPNSLKLSRLFLWHIQRISKQAYCIMPVSKYLQNSMMKLDIKGKYEVVYNVVDTNMFKIEKKHNEKIKFVHVSNFNEKQKNIKGLLDAINKLSEYRTDFEFQIIGDGPISNVINYSNNLGISKDVLKIYGAKPIEEIAIMINLSDVFVLFSNYETFSCVISEAQSSGLPVISTDLDAINERIDNTSGIFVEIDNVDELISAMSYVIDNINKYDNKLIRKKAIEKYSYESVGNQIYGIYLRAIKDCPE